MFELNASGSAVREELSPEAHFRAWRTTTPRAEFQTLIGILRQWGNWPSLAPEAAVERESVILFEICFKEYICEKSNEAWYARKRIFYLSSFGNAAKDDSESRREDLELVFANLADATFLLDQDGRISDANPAACTLLEYQKEELLSRELSDLVTATVREDTLKLVRSLEIEVPLTVQCSFGTRKGEDVFVELRLARYFSKARVSIIASCRNVADQQRARADLESALAKLNRSELRLRRSEATLAEAQKTQSYGKCLLAAINRTNQVVRGDVSNLRI